MQSVLSGNQIQFAKHRFPIEQDIRYQCVRGRHMHTAGEGRTLEISSREIRFTTQHTLVPGDKVWLAVNWPALFENGLLMQLEIFGWIIRAGHDVATVKIEQYVFATRGALRAY